MLSYKIVLELENICYSVTSRWFAMFCNETCRGENFTWDKFPSIVNKQVKTQIAMRNFPEKKRDECVEYAESFNTMIANGMVKSSGFDSKG